MSQVLPVANELDPQRGIIPLELRAEMAELGFFGILIPEEYGGLGLGVFEYALITEELSRAWMSVASIITRSGVAAGLDPSHRDRILPLAARGEWLGAFAMSEPGAGSDIASIRTRADKVDGGWRITGQKMWCTFADQADGIVIVARTTPFDPAHRHEGIRRFILYKDRDAFPEGVEGTPVRKIGYHGWHTYELSFDGCFVPDDGLIGFEPVPGQEDRGFKRVAEGMLVPRIHTAARAIGLARGALEDSIKYVQQREQFGHPIGDFQATRFRIATMATAVDTCRALLYETAADADEGVLSETKAAMLKYAATEMAETVTSDALQIHGGAGYTTDFPIERYWRDARLTKIFEGTSEIMLRLISDRLLPPTPFR
ncbi:Acyl-CoA dehydrogenase [Microbacterium trichothecenolyticum]|uniref:Acyl-CoA dehydrogenase n=2 Tax=Microbacterium trichothecenolyticum TaxID=69370 RepID=A0A0M2H744_MICTR|nr:Acyl-CoA dehydrogenase [Microbacterium trichothecenolyticum]